MCVGLGDGLRGALWGCREAGTRFSLGPAAPASAPGLLRVSPYQQARATLPSTPTTSRCNCAAPASPMPPRNGCTQSAMLMRVARARCPLHSHDNTSARQPTRACAMVQDLTSAVQHAPGQQPSGQRLQHPPRSLAGPRGFSLSLSKITRARGGAVPRVPPRAGRTRRAAARLRASHAR